MDIVTVKLALAALLLAAGAGCLTAAQVLRRREASHG